MQSTLCGLKSVLVTPVIVIGDARYAAAHLVRVLCLHVRAWCGMVQALNV